ncbi:hypothetical protein CO709_25055 [Burkholderia thailandensis]|nr:hypothetical protein CO709_25055 [Burkholderia thailandensis]
MRRWPSSLPPKAPGLPALDVLDVREPPDVHDCRASRGPRDIRTREYAAWRPCKKPAACAAGIRRRSGA